jgi:cell division protein ZapA
MEEQEAKQITVLIANRPYPLKIKSSDEPAIRRIVKELNEKVNRFQLTYTNKDKQDCLAMALLTYAVDLHMEKIQTAMDVNLNRKLESIDALLDSLVA